MTHTRIFKATSTCLCH